MEAQNSVKEKAQGFRPDCLVKVPTTLDDFFKTWLIFLKPYHELTDRQIDIAACFLKHRYELSTVIKDERLLDENVMSESTKRKIREECDVTNAHFQVIIGELRKHKIIVNGAINPKYIPALKENAENFSFMLYFQLQ